MSDPAQLSIVPFTRSAVVGREREYMAEATHTGNLSGDGPFTARCRALIERRLDVPGALLTTSCTHALEMCALLLDVRPGDEVIVPSFTFVSTINAFVLRGAVPVFIDSRPDTLNLDESQLEALISPRTRAVVLMHYAGIACEMNRIMEIAGRHGVPVIEDNAHGLFGRYDGRWLGTFGKLATLSFHSTKNFSSGEGGALLVNDAVMLDRAEIIREKGTNRSRFFRGQVDKYTWVDVGSSYLPADLLTAFLLGQLESETEIQRRRRHIWETYRAELGGWAEQTGVALPVIPPGCEPAWHLFFLMTRSLEDRTRLIRHLDDRMVSAVFHYQPLHLSPMGRRYAAAGRTLPVAEAAGDRLLRLPMYNDMNADDLARVVDAVRSWR